ncbi:Trk system potassium uptake protein [Magnetospirillum sp. LM-5]|uniref:TrkH family potassium uptake protein n=1 Tax=Magnetospirillum sp. LM-5 TaxID=2681466 RepID=UPI001383E7FA|nr:TrkH family potassium uptake protein [Magnetospirillum sp. LM-5]CAA7618110.1 Trk system potassium uptake protein [Magnetospirillum sp. LM-5]
MIDVRPVIYVNGILLLVLAGAMGLPALVDWVGGDDDWRVFAISAAVTLLVGAAMMLATYSSERPKFTTRQAFLLTATAWFGMALFGALPFTFSGLKMSYTDGFFEVVSGLTTTGATVIVGLDQAPKGILLWRALVNWLGGVGIIVMAVAVLPFLGIGGMQLFKMESSDKSDKVRARTSQVAGGIVQVYAVLTLLCTLLLWLAGMNFFDSLCHAMSALATGGFSTSDASLATWDIPAVHWILTLFMALGGATLALFVAPWQRPGWNPLKDSQTQWYMTFLAFFSALLTLWQWGVNDMEPGDALRHATFNVVSITTTTGFVSTDYSLWGGFPQVVFFFLCFIGGCTGSTSGAVKVFRWEVLFGMAGIHLRRLLHPHGVFVINFNRRLISEAVVDSVLGFVVMYFLTYAVFTFLLAVAGLDFVTALTGSAAALGNIGPGLGEVIGPAGTYKPLPDIAKWLLSIEMIMGRLELFTVIALFSRSFWRG